MVLILRKCKKDGSSRCGFVYGQAGEVVTAPVWDPTPKCGNGLHGLKQGTGDWSLLKGNDWLVIEAEEKDIVDIDNEKCKFRTGKILYRGDETGLHQYAATMATNSESAYYWAKIIGDQEIMRDRVTDSEWAYYWARFLGNRKIMRDRVTESEWAYWWAKDIGDKEIMRDRVTTSSSAYWWSKNIGDREIMIDRITDSAYAYYWARDIGDKQIMRDRITDPYIEKFNQLPS
jgi:hypothetical protein